jgi:CRP-like cAMP-binding protein
MRVVPIKKAWRGEANCRDCAVRNSVLFAGLDESDFATIHQPIDDLLIPAGGYLFHAEEHGGWVFTIRSGVLKLLQYLPDGTQRIVRLLRMTDVAGLEALLAQPYHHDAVALTPLEICRIPVPVVNQLAERQPKLHRELLNRWQRALNEADAWLTQFSTGTARQRVARLLLRLADPNDECRLRLFGREDMGAMLGITTETASRVIAEYRRRSLLRDDGTDGLLQIDLGALRAIAEGGGRTP